MSPLSSQVAPFLGLGIANERGVPGTLGCVVRTLHDGRDVLLSTWHVLFGDDAAEQDAVWRVADSGRRCYQLGQTLYGKIGDVTLGQDTFYVDCAVSSLAAAPTDSIHPRQGVAKQCVSGHAGARLGESVTKTGSATGVTRGVVTDLNFSSAMVIRGREYFAQRQLLVKPIEDRGAFAAEGDSGSVVVNSSGEAVGLLWGTTVRGEGVASPIAPVLYALNIELG